MSPHEISSTGHHHQRAYSVMAVPSELEYHRRQSSTQTNLMWYQEIYKRYGYHPKNSKPSYFGHYLLLHSLGEGEFAKVKSGVHVDTNQEVAIKIMRKDHIRMASLTTKLEREISVLKTVRHPYIVKLFEVLDVQTYIGIVMERAIGGELFNYILKHRYLPENEAKRLFAQLISGVHYMHQKHIVHRDLKLENLLLSKDRDIVITDFGFANRFDVETTDLMATSCGSPCYAAPELVISDDNQYVGTAVDIWSCGVILFAMLCGYLPFDDDPSNPQGANINLLYKYILNTPLELPKNMSPDAKDLLRRMLVPDPTKRCTMDVILNHPWLSEYSNLLCKSIHQLETEACENVLFWTPNHVVHSDSRYDSPVPTVPKEPEPRDASMPQHDSVTSDKKDQVPLLEQDENSSSSVLDSEKVETPPPPPSSTSTSKGDAPASFLQAKFFSTVQRHVSATSRRVPFTNQQSSSTPQHNRISSPFVRTKSTSVQPKARRDRTISETHSKKPQELSILPSVSEQTVISTANGKTSPFDKQNRTKGQKLMDWFKRKPSQSTRRVVHENYNVNNNNSQENRYPERPVSALPNPVRAMPIGKPFGSYAADYNDAKLRLHRGAVDQDTLTSRPPNEVLVAIRNALTMMGIDAKRHSDFKLKCTRPKRNSNQPLSKSERSRKISTSVPFKNLFNKSTPDVHPDFQKPSVTGETIYGEQSIDSGDEVRFTVELAKIENLPGLYVVDIRRVRGSIWAFKYLYHTLLDILDLVGKGGYMAHRPTISENPLNPVEQNRKSYMTTSSSGSSIMLFEEPVAVR